MADEASERYFRDLDRVSIDDLFTNFGIQIDYGVDILREFDNVLQSYIVDTYDKDSEGDAIARIRKAIDSDVWGLKHRDNLYKLHSWGQIALLGADTEHFEKFFCNYVDMLAGLSQLPADFCRSGRTSCGDMTGKGELPAEILMAKGVGLYDDEQPIADAGICPEEVLTLAVRSGKAYRPRDLTGFIPNTGGCFVIFICLPGGGMLCVDVKPTDTIGRIAMTATMLSQQAEVP